MSSDVEFLHPGKDPFFPFMRWACEAWQSVGGRTRPDVHCRHFIRAAMGRLLGFALFGSKHRLIVCGDHHIETCAWPWNYRYEIVPLMWDLWPDNYAAFRRFVRLNRVKTVFCTASQSCAWVRENCPHVKVIWIPEAADGASLPLGLPLAERSIDVLSYGRRIESWHVAITELAAAKRYKYQAGAGRTFEELAATVRSAKISICTPLIDTTPEKAKGVETLTQRYWEAMFSGTVIVGRAPKELVDLCGYNPVVTVGSKVEDAIVGVLSDLGRYQKLVDRNRQTALAMGDWKQRAKMMLEGL